MSEGVHALIVTNAKGSSDLEIPGRARATTLQRGDFFAGKHATSIRPLDIDARMRLFLREIVHSERKVRRYVWLFVFVNLLKYYIVILPLWKHRIVLVARAIRKFLSLYLVPSISIVCSSEIIILV